ncbi:hypothetical protein BDM02DRAFT_2707888 [Thelephora ganbajun]|uniref:Uncharacterized protein n=1 Tax=Thelephora ganbajun TaxID=370292 RepID=A0ACB6ZDI2_THEGA|nr:hypothetical protein BDM02DRAFT_2707888 [Thelephora ganbajun]
MVPQSVPQTVRGARGGARGAGRKHSQRQPSASTRNKVSTQQAPLPRLTHFIALPLGHHVGLRELMGRFGRSLLSETDPTILGLDQSVLIPPRRLHFTLGVMSLASTSSAAGMEGMANSMIQPRTLDDAVQFLESLKPRIDGLLQGLATSSANQTQKICVVLNSMDTMKQEKDEKPINSGKFVILSTLLSKRLGF